jgi:hypothetical protein
MKIKTAGRFKLGRRGRLRDKFLPRRFNNNFGLAIKGVCGTTFLLATSAAGWQVFSGQAARYRRQI